MHRSVIGSVKDKAIDGTRSLTRQFQFWREFQRDNMPRKDLSPEEKIRDFGPSEITSSRQTSQRQIVEIYVYNFFVENIIIFFLI